MKCWFLWLRFSGPPSCCWSQGDSVRRWRDRVFHWRNSVCSSWFKFQRCFGILRAPPKRQKCPQSLPDQISRRRVQTGRSADVVHCGQIRSFHFKVTNWKFSKVLRNLTLDTHIDKRSMLRFKNPTVEDLSLEGGSPADHCQIQRKMPQTVTRWIREKSQTRSPTPPLWPWVQMRPNGKWRPKMWWTTKTKKIASKTLKDFQ